MSAPAGPPLNNAPAPQPRFDQLRCRDCGRPVGMLAGFGFCRGCGGPLCFYCASNNVIMSEGRRTLIIPLIFLPLALSRTTSITSKVSFCRSCMHDVYGEKAKVLPLSIMGSLIVALVLALPFLAVAGLDAGAGITIMSVLFGILSWLPIFFTLRYLNERKHRPSCPVCGKDATGLLFKSARAQGIRQGWYPDFIECGCGYQGPRAPLDGIWLFVDRFGAGPLAGGPVEKMALASEFVRKDRNR